jgi:hypothetical protein
MGQPAVQETAARSAGAGEGASVAGGKFDRLNRITLMVFAPILILTGIGGLTLPASASPMSNAAPYDVFHIAFGTLGVLLVIAKRPKWIAAFNVGFGMIDLWQAVAGFTGLYPARLFALRPADHVAHIVIGAALVAIGALGMRRR